MLYKQLKAAEIPSIPSFSPQQPWEVCWFDWLAQGQPASFHD